MRRNGDDDLDDVRASRPVEHSPILRRDASDAMEPSYDPCMIRYEIGDVVNGTLELVRRLGNGGFGSVYVARDLINDQEVAVKLLEPGRTSGLDQLRREVGPLRKLNHPNIVKVRSQGLTSNEIWYIEMELVQGETLEARVSRAGPLRGVELLDLGTQLLEALVIIHPDEDRLAELGKRDELSIYEAPRDR